MINQIDKRFAITHMVGNIHIARDYADQRMGSVRWLGKEPIKPDLPAVSVRDLEYWFP
jgi:hypothetical protein